MRGLLSFRRRSIVPTSCASTPASTTASTSPKVCASYAEMTRPVSIMYLQRVAVMRWVAAAETTAGSPPCMTSGNPNVASSVATTMSEMHGNSIPPPRVAPWHSEMTGCLCARSVSRSLP